MRTNKLRSKLSLLFIALAALIAIPAVAVLADDITNKLDSTVDAAAEVMALEANGANGTTQLAVVQRNNDGKNGCNLTGSTSLGVSVSSSNTSVATVSPSSVTFASCGDVKTVTVTPHNQGSATISLSQTSNTTDGSFNLAPATFTVNVAPPPNTPPKVSVSGVDIGANYEINDVPSATCQVEDTQDGNSSFPATLSLIDGPLSAYGLGSQEASCKYTDGGGLSASASETYNIVDNGKPVISDQGPTTTANGTNGWYTSAVTNTFKAQDFNGTTPTPDAGAGFAGQTNPYTFTQGSGIAEGSAVKIASGTVQDVAGNTGASIDSAAFQIDLSDPSTPTFNDGPAADSSHYFGSVPAEPTCSSSDAVSGLKDCVVTGYSTAVGNHTLTATATDNAGNTNTATRTYEVKAWTLNGFYQPVDMGIMNYAKGGSTVPLKFEVFAGSTELTDTTIVKYFTQKINCAAGPGDAIEAYASGSTSLRYDTISGQFIFNWKTLKAPGSCYRVTLETNDGSSIYADFKLT